MSLVNAVYCCLLLLCYNYYYGCVSVVKCVSNIIRAVAPSPAGPAMAELFFAAGTKILNIEDMHSKHTFKLGGVLA